MNASINLGVPISQEIIYKQCFPTTKLDASLIKIIQSHSLSSKIKFDNGRFDIFKYITVYNLIQVENDGIYIYLC